MRAFVSFMASPAGRILRIIAGGAIINWSHLALSGDTRLVVAALGAVPILTGVFNVCLVGPLLGQPLKGRR